MDTNLIVQIFPLISILLAVVCVLVQALMPVFRIKGNVRLAGSILLGAGLSAESIVQMATRHRLWPEVILLPISGLLIWLGVRKHSRDPEGKTPPAAIL
jgi:putative exporter of polyketide antibiotics